MDEESLNHTRWECKYHIIWIPRYRRKVPAILNLRKNRYRKSDQNEPEDRLAPTGRWQNEGSRPDS